MTKIVLVAVAATAFAAPVQAASVHAAPGTAASTYVAERPDSSAHGGRRASAMVLRDRLRDRLTDRRRAEVAALPTPRP